MGKFKLRQIPPTLCLDEHFFKLCFGYADYCHKMGVANRDIKLENTLLDGSPKPLVKITDFGYCKSDQESLPKSKVGTPGYTGTVVLSGFTQSKRLAKPQPPSTFHLFLHLPPTVH